MTAADADASEPDYCFNLGYAYFAEKNPAAGHDEWLHVAYSGDGGVTRG